MRYNEQAIVRSVALGVAAVTALAGAGKQVQNPTAANAAEVAISSATVPAGGTAQLSFTMTQPRPILSTGTGFDLAGFDVNGIALWSTNGLACGVGSVHNGVLTFSAADPSSVLGTGVDYPFLTIALTAPLGVKTGTAFTFGWSPEAWLTSLAGPYALTVKPGRVTIGGSVSIRGVYPGGGTYPAGTVIRIPGTGFQPGLRLQTAVVYSSISITPNEIVLTLKSQTTMDSQRFQVINKDGSSASYFAYLRGSMVRPPSKTLLQTGEFAFPLQTQAVVNVPAGGGLAGSQWVALALQNPNPGPAAVTIELQPYGQGRSALVVLPAGGRLVDTVQGLLNGIVPQPGDIVRVTSTSMIQMFGINGDETAQTLKPFAVSF